MLKQCATTDITAVRAASTMLAMGAMLGRLVVQLKMPRLDAYGSTSQRPVQVPGFDDIGRLTPLRRKRLAAAS